jgi:hypothetical protein
MSILASLAEIGRIFSERLKDKIDSVNAPKVIKKNIFVGEPKQSNSTSSIDIVIDHPAAPAYEWGSGIHATRGSKREKYRIPKEGGAAFVAFGKDKWLGHTPPKGIDYFFFTSVQHPGVAQRPFIKPTIEDTKAEFRKILGQGFKAELLAGKEKVEVIEIK